MGLFAFGSACGGVAEGPSTEDAHAPPAADAGHDVATSKTDAPLADAKPVEKDAGEPGHDSAPADAAVPPAGTLVDVAPLHVIFGITSDNYLIYETETEQGATAILALSLAPGSKPILLAGSTVADAGPDGGTGAGAATAYVVGAVVFVQTQMNDNYVGALSVWTSALAAPRMLTGASVLGAIGVSSDSKYFVYTGDSNATGSTATLYASTVEPGATSTVLATSIEPTTACGFYAVFSGTYALVQYCPVNDAGGASPAAVYAFDEATWSETPLVSDVLAFWQDNTATDVAVITAANALEVAPIVGGGTPAQIDTGVTLAYLSLTDKFVAYNTSAGALRTAALPFTGTPTTLQTSNVNGVTGISSDEKWAITNQATDPSTGYPMDLSLASLSAATASTSLTTGNICYTNAEGFTKDLSHLVFLSDIKISSEALSNASLSAAPVGTSGPVTTITTEQAWFWSMLDGARMVYEDNYNSALGHTGRITLHVIDLSTSTPGTTIQTGADAYTAVSTDGTKLVYSIDTSSTANGLYVYDIPQ